MNNSKNEINLKKLENKLTLTKRLFALLLVCVLVIFFSSKSFSSLLENDTAIKSKSELTYYLNVTYDGIDKNGKKSTSTTTSELRSGDIFVEDKIPEGLQFEGFVTTNDGSIGAVKRSDKSLCTGKVVDDTSESGNTGAWNEDKTEYTYHGLHYNANTRTVTFRVRNLQAGCELTVGIKTKAPKIDDPDTEEKELRRDFYNYALAREKNLTVKSNMVHAYIGKKIDALYSVKYEYEGELPDNVPTPPEETSYVVGANVGVFGDINVEGYNFSGWTTEDVSVRDSKFRMPDKTVTFKGSFEKSNTNKVTYKINGSAPEEYIVPKTLEYVPNASVSLDVLKAGDVIGFYKFLGWTSNDVSIDKDSKFIMPDKDVLIVGEFQPVTYKVSYKFYDTNLPSNANSLLPHPQVYEVGEKVKLEKVNSNVATHTFLGWYSEDEFIMLDHDITVYGEWKVNPPRLSPSIKSEIVNKQSYYRIGDTVTIKVTITNPSEYILNNVVLKINKDRVNFNTNANIEILSDNYISIKQIESMKAYEVYYTYKITNKDKKNVKITSEIKGASSSVGIELENNKVYKTSSTVKIASTLKICNKIEGIGPGNVFQYHITGLEDKFDTWLVLDGNTCEVIPLAPGVYNIMEVVPADYNLVSVLKDLKYNNDNIKIDANTKYEIEFVNEFKKKGYFHSFGRTSNKILQKEEAE